MFTGKYPVARLRRIVEAAGATLEAHAEGRRQEYEAVAPDGSHWESGLTALLSTAFKGPASWSEETRKDLAERVACYGRVEKCTEERCGNCNVPEPEPVDPVKAHDDAERASMTLPQRLVLTSLRSNGDTTGKALLAALQKDYVYLSRATVEMALTQLLNRGSVKKIGRHFRASI